MGRRRRTSPSNSQSFLQTASYTTLLIAITVPLLFGLLRLRQAHPLLTSYLSTYLILINTLTFMLYSHDKARSRVAGWRVTEMRLHTCELAGGWPAAFMAQRIFQHKIRKVKYQVGFWVIVIMHELVWLDVSTEGRVRRWLMRSGR
jgi:uncharacterized membrane protein YsdA (DUF1294 family)